LMFKMWKFSMCTLWLLTKYCCFADINKQFLFCSSERAIAGDDPRHGMSRSCSPFTRFFDDFFQSLAAGSVYADS
jgi:hypothetical protein